MKDMPANSRSSSPLRGVVIISSSSRISTDSLDLQVQCDHILHREQRQ